MSDEKIVTKNLFLEQMKNFENETSAKIIKVLDEENYIIETEVLGLIAMAKALALTYSNTEDELNSLLDTAKYMLDKAEFSIKE